MIAIEGNADKALIDDSIPHAWIRIGQAGTGFKKLAEEKVEEVIMIGTIKRPTLKDLVPDMRTAAFFAKVGMKSLGDDGILRALVKEIEGEGMTVRGIHEVLPELLIKKACWARSSRRNRQKKIFAGRRKLQRNWGGWMSARR